MIKQKSKTFTPGIAAGAEDVKYQNKYKELKRKVKEIEAVSIDAWYFPPYKRSHSGVKDNDKLQFKVLQAKKSINRMKIERASVYTFTCFAGRLKSMFTSVFSTTVFLRCLLPPN